MVSILNEIVDSNSHVDKWVQCSIPFRSRVYGTPGKIQPFVDRPVPQTKVGHQPLFLLVHGRTLGKTSWWSFQNGSPPLPHMAEVQVSAFPVSKPIIITILLWYVSSPCEVRYRWHWRRNPQHFTGSPLNLTGVMGSYLGEVIGELSDLIRDLSQTLLLILNEATLGHREDSQIPLYPCCRRQMLSQINHGQMLRECGCGI